jgi:cell division protein FtsX
VIRHALAEGWQLLRRRWPVSLGLAVALAVPIAFAGVAWTVVRWLEPVAALADQTAVVPVLLHPHLDAAQRGAWIDGQRRDHPEWRIEELSPERLGERLIRWFPYLAGLLEDGGLEMLSPLVEIETTDPAALDGLEDSPAVIAVGPRTSVHRAVGRSARSLGWALGLVSAALAVAAVLFTGVWVHLELYRHADEITIMRLIGATEPTVRGPFLVAILAPGALAALLAVAGTVLVAGPLSRALGVLGLPGLEVPAGLLALEAASGIGLPLAAALVTLARHAASELDGS